MNFLRNLAFQFWPLAVMVAAIWTLPEKYHQALGQGWVALIAGSMIAGGVILWSLASRSAYEARAYRLGRNCYIQGLKLQIDCTVKGQEVCRNSNIPGLVDAYDELLDRQKLLLRHAEETAAEEDAS